MLFINPNVISQVEQYSQENDEVLWEMQTTKKQIDKLDLEYLSLSDYQNQALAILVVKDIFFIIVGFIILVVISIVLSMLRLTPIVGGFWVLLLLGLAFAYFKLILTAIILMAIATFILNNEPSDVVIAVNAVVFLATFLVFRTFTIYKNKAIISYFDELNNIYNQNTEYILHLLYEPLGDYIESAGLVDMNSIQENGFSFVEKEYLQKYLMDEVKRNNLKFSVLHQSNTILYQSTKPLPTTEMTTTYLQID